MSLDHDFLLLDTKIDGEWHLLRFNHDPRAIRLHDDLLRYMLDTLNWIPTCNPALGEQQTGLCMWGVTTIGLKGAAMAEQVFESWAELFSIGPPQLILTGSYVYPADGGPNDGYFEKLSFDRDCVVGALRTLAEYSRQVASGDGRLYILHQGV